jgi:GntR family transcriptional regulator
VTTYAGELRRATPVPLYYQVFQILHREILMGRYRPGDQIPTEAELQERFEVSRATVRQAVTELVYLGLVERKRSKGTTVSNVWPQTTLNDLASFTAEMMGGGFDLTTHILDFQHLPATAPLTDLLALADGEQIVRMDRLRLVSGKPISVERWHTPLRYFPGLHAGMFGGAGMAQSTYYVLMQHYGLVVSHAVDTVSPVGVEPREARLLEVEPGHPVLLRTRVSYADDGRPVTYASGVYLIQLKFMLGQARSSAGAGNGKTP